MKKIIALLLLMLMLVMLLVGCVSRQDYDALVVEYDGLRVRVESAESDLVAAQGEVQTLQSDLSAEQSKAGKLESNLSALQSKAGKLESDLSAEKSKTKNLESDLSAAQSQLSSLKIESGRVKDDLTKAQTRIAELEEIAPKLLHKDDFSTFALPSKSEEAYEFSYEDGEYRIQVKKTDWLAWCWYRGQFADFSLEVDARLVSGPMKSGYGLIFRKQDNEDNFYCFIVTGDGYYKLLKRLEGKWITMQREKKSTFIKEDNTNHLKVVCKDSQIAIYVNGYHLITKTDNSFTEGQVGMIANSDGRNGLVAFDNFAVCSVE